MKNSPFISFIMPAKNAIPYIQDAIQPFIDTESIEWELVIVDDHSSDCTFDVSYNASQKNERIKVYKNVGHGRIAALNYGYTKASGSIIKTIDADDVLLLGFFDVLFEHANNEALCHAAYVTDQNLKVKGHYAVDKNIIHKDFEYCLRHTKGLPRCLWSFNKRLADIIFPMPESLTYEDVWMTLIIIKHSLQTLCLDKYLYYYRQHDAQIYGGIMNLDLDTMATRGEGILKLIKVLETEGVEQLGPIVKDPEIFAETKTYCHWLKQKNVTFYEVLSSSISIQLKLKALLYLKFNMFATLALRTKWAIDKIF